MSPAPGSRTELVYSRAPTARESMSDLASLRVALVHDWLTGMRGGERALEVLCEIFPQADLYTLVAVPERLSPALRKMHIVPSVLQNLPGGVTHYRHYLPLMPWLIRRFRLYDYDLVFSSSHAVAKGVRVTPFVPHICYLHAPMRYMWDGFADYFGPGKASLPVRIAARAIRPWLQRWDRRSAVNVHRFTVNSVNIQSQVRRIYGRNAEVIYGPVDLRRFAPAERTGGTRGDGYLMVGAFAPNKRVHVAVEAFTRMGKRLRIVGSGPEEARCRAIAGPTVEFLGEVNDEQVAALYAQARGFIFPGVEDFGLTPLEAQASGAPVIALAAGGALETVTPQTGLLFTPRPDQSETDALIEAVGEFERRRAEFTVDACVANAARFSRDTFKQRVTAIVEDTLAAYREGGVGALTKWR
jgi:glycosyltransferase involved in cell wall biosynthesis